MDGVRGGSIKLVLFPRGHSFDYPFHQATDAWSPETQRVGWTLCYSDGELRVLSIKNAESECWEASKGGFLHVESVRINDAYRPASCTNVIATALRLAFLEPKLVGEWTLATAISDFRVYE